MKAKVKTKSNFRNLNHTWLTVAEMKGTRVTCIVPDDISGKSLNVDFTIAEIEEFDYENPNKALLKFMHDAISPINRIKSLARMLDKGGILSTESEEKRLAALKLIQESADSANTELDTFYLNNVIR
jgi:hypothetical protein